jgi:signal transduction histidine kinase
MDVHAETIRVDELVERVADRFRPLTARKGLDLATSCHDLLPEVLTDRQRVEQILTNLLANAVKFTERGTITIEARIADEDADGFTPLTNGAEPVTSADPAVVILVRDTGIGIRHDDVARLAGDFEQVDREAAAKYGGTGLGLSISRRLAHRLGGRIAVRSRYDEGSTFALYLPLAS